MYWIELATPMKLLTKSEMLANTNTPSAMRKLDCKMRYPRNGDITIREMQSRLGMVNTFSR